MPAPWRPEEQAFPVPVPSMDQEQQLVWLPLKAELHHIQLPREIGERTTDHKINIRPGVNPTFLLLTVSPGYELSVLS